MHSLFQPVFITREGGGTEYLVSLRTGRSSDRGRPKYIVTASTAEEAAKVAQETSRSAGGPSAVRAHVYEDFFRKSESVGFVNGAKFAAFTLEDKPGDLERSWWADDEGFEQPEERLCDRFEVASKLAAEAEAILKEGHQSIQTPLRYVAESGRVVQMEIEKLQAIKDPAMVLAAVGEVLKSCAQLQEDCRELEDVLTSSTRRHGGSSR